MKQKVHLMREMTLLAAVALASLVGRTEMISGVSPNVCLCVNASKSVLWQTVQGAEVSLDWPRDAVRAVLTVQSEGRRLCRVETSDRSARTLAYPLVRPICEAEEKLLSFCLEWFAAGDEMLDCTQQAEAALPFDGSNGACLVRPVIPAVCSFYKGALLQVPADSTLSLDGSPVAARSPGWTWLTASRGPQHTLALTVAGETITRGVLFTGPGFMLIFR